MYEYTGKMRRKVLLFLVSKKPKGEVACVKLV